MNPGRVVPESAMSVKSTIRVSDPESLANPPAWMWYVVPSVTGKENSA